MFKAYENFSYIHYNAVLVNVTELNQLTSVDTTEKFVQCKIKVFSRGNLKRKLR